MLARKFLGQIRDNVNLVFSTVEGHLNIANHE